MAALDPAYVAARRVLLDALRALTPHGPAVIVAGAQAVYLRTGSADLAIAPYTTDGDLAIDPHQLADVPLLAAAMEEAGFALSTEPGIWHAPARVDGMEVAIPVDLIVPERVAVGRGRRSVRLGPHGRRAARHAAGLEAALVDHAPMTIAALDPNDNRGHSGALWTRITSSRCALPTRASWWISRVRDEQVRAHRRTGAPDAPRPVASFARPTTDRRRRWPRRRRPTVASASRCAGWSRPSSRGA